MRLPLLAKSLHKEIKVSSKNCASSIAITSSSEIRFCISAILFTTVAFIQSLLCDTILFLSYLISIEGLKTINFFLATFSLF